MHSNIEVLLQRLEILLVKCLAQSLFLELSLFLQTKKNASFLFHVHSISLENANQCDLLNSWSLQQVGTEKNGCYDKKIPYQNLWNIKKNPKIPLWNKTFTKNN